MPHAQANGLDLYWEEHGSGEPLLCVMGLGADHRAWVLQRQVFAARYRTILFDNRDCGRSTVVDGPYEIADMARDTLGLADALGLESFHLLGISLGAAVCQHVALAAPGRVRTLTLAAAWGGASAEYGRLRTKAWERDMRNASREDFLEAMMLLTLSERFFEIPGAVEEYKRVALGAPDQQPPEAFIRQAQAAARHDLRDRLHQLAMPVHVISGSNDILIPSWKQRELAALISGAELTVLDGVAHSMTLDGAQVFNDAVLGFIERASAEREAA
jgi:pimeloyl-ACP methyl ester carboxylesterase